MNEYLAEEIAYMILDHDVSDLLDAESFKEEILKVIERVYNEN